MEVVTMIDRPLYVDKIMAYADTPFVKILTGVRRCGKSTILKMIMERLKTERNIPAERMISCRYDSMEFEDMTAKQMYAQLKVIFPKPPKRTGIYGTRTGVWNRSVSWANPQSNKLSKCFAVYNRKTN